MWRFRFFPNRNGRFISEARVPWPAPGSEDTELGVLMELEVGHGETGVRRSFREGGWSQNRTFTTPGTYAYFCSLHPHMTGVVVVEAATGAGATHMMLGFRCLRHGRITSSQASLLDYRRACGVNVRYRTKQLG
jgi:hypothetical protein